MLRSLLVGVNESRWSAIAVESSLRIAKSSNLPVTFFGVLDVEGLTAPQTYPAGAGAFKTERDAKLLAAAQERLQQALNSASARAEESGVEYSVRTAEGRPAVELGKEVQRHDLLVIGKRAIPTTDHDPAPSKTLTEIVRLGSRPIVITTEGPSETGPVMVAYDGSAQAARALASFVTSGLHADRVVHLVGVDKDNDGVADNLELARDYLALHGRQSELHLLPSEGGVGKTIITLAQRLSSSLLVMGVYGEPRMKEMLFGSVTRSLLAAVPTPLFLDH